eukprot:516857_1
MLDLSELTQPAVAVQWAMVALAAQWIMVAMVAMSAAQRTMETTVVSALQRTSLKTSRPDPDPRAESKMQNRCEMNAVPRYQQELLRRLFHCNNLKTCID